MYYKDDDVVEEEDNYASRKLMIRQMQVSCPTPRVNVLIMNNW